MIARFQCWFCGESIAVDDASAVRLSADNLWSGSDDDEPMQEFYAHSHCAVDRLKGATMAFEPDLFLESDRAPH